MIHPLNGPLAQQGWQCPVCKAVFAPFFPQCTNCGPKKTLAAVSPVPEPAKQPNPLDLYGKPEISGNIAIGNPPVIGSGGTSGTVVYKTMPKNWSYTLS